MRIKKITGKLTGDKVDPKDINIIINKVNEIVDVVNSLSYNQQRIERSITRNSYKRIKESKK